MISNSGISSREELANFVAVRFVRDLARKEGSPELVQLASRVAVAVRLTGNAGDDPFAKVKGLITDMVVRMEDLVQQRSQGVGGEGVRQKRRDRSRQASTR